jgi:uncharacterized iron-regulated protein
MQTFDSDIHLHAARWLLACAIFAAVGCSSTTTQLVPTNGYSSALGAKHPLVGKIYRGSTREPVAADALFAALGSARYLVLGETHDNRDHHQLQAQLLGRFLEAQPGAAVAFEMLDEDDAGKLTQAAQSADELAQRVAWADSGWPDFSLYQPVFDAALSAHARIVAAHPSAEHVRGSMQGIDAAEARDLGIDTPLPEAQIQAQHDEIRESHCGRGNDAMLKAMQSAQVYKDAFMARAVKQTNAPTALVTGSGHARTDRAVPYFLARAAAGKTQSIAFIEVDDGKTVASAYDTTAFDFVVFTPRASDEDPCEKFRKQLEQMRQHPNGA